MVNKSALIGFVLMLLFYSPVYALQVITPVEGETTYIEMSQKDLNVIKTPFHGVKALSSSNRIDVKVEGKSLFVKFTSTIPEPQEIILTNSAGDIYPLVLKPKGIPSETIVLRIREETGEALKWELAQGQVKAVKELIKGMYVEMPPRGFFVEKLEEDRTEWKEVSRTLIRKYNGAMLTGEVYVLKAIEPVSLDEKEFHKPGILAVSIDKHELAPGESTKVYVVNQKKGG